MDGPGRAYAINPPAKPTITWFPVLRIIMQISVTIAAVKYLLS